jgi:ABC-2 type transport system ATP-binding protein
MAPSTGPNAAPAAAVEALTKTYGGFTAVNRVSFTLARGGTTALLGGNGAGKTTTIAMMLGLTRPNAGRVRILGYDIAADGAKARARMNFQSPYVDLPKRLTVRRNLMVYARLYGVKRPKEAAEAIAERLRLSDHLKKPTGALSAGQATRVGLAKALINDPELLLLDEPTASLDPDSADWVRSELEAWRARTGATILLASHNMAEVERLADRVLMMKAGRIVDDSEPKQLLEKYGRGTLEEVFLDVARRPDEGEAAA